MADICGRIEELLPGTYYWNLENKTIEINSSCSSERFTVYDEREKDKYDLFLRLDDHVGLSYLFICRTARFILQLDVHVKLHYKNESLEFSCKHVRLNENLKKIKNSIKTPVLLGVTCTFSNIQVFSKGLDKSGELKSREEPGSSKTNQDKKTVNPEIKEHPNIRGLLALSKNLQDIFLDEDESDVIFNVGDQKYPAHKIIIRARSPVFYAMLKNDMKEKSQGFVDIPDCDQHIFRDFLLYLYTGKIDNISNENICELYYMSDKYDVKELKKDCVEFISSNLSVDIICDVISLATRHCESDLLSQATAFFIENAKVILVSVNWQKFVKENPVEANELFIKTFNKMSEK